MLPLLFGDLVSLYRSFETAEVNPLFIELVWLQNLIFFRLVNIELDDIIGHQQRQIALEVVHNVELGIVSEGGVGHFALTDHFFQGSELSADV